MFIVLSFIILVAGFSIVANGIMLVREKRREIAILKSMGATDGAVMRTFLYVGLYMGVLGVLVGIGVGVATCLLLGRFGLTLDTDVYYISKLPVRLDPGEIAAIFGAGISIVLGATLYPALVAARLRPVDGLRYDQN
jgi:lipoprotein-releasing system permease protein